MTTTQAATNAAARLTDQQIEQIAKNAYADGAMGWSGFKKDAAGRYTIPDLMPIHFDLCRAIERAVLASLAPAGLEVDDEH